MLKSLLNACSKLCEAKVMFSCCKAIREINNWHSPDVGSNFNASFNMRQPWGGGGECVYVYVYMKLVCAFMDVGSAKKAIVCLGKNEPFLWGKMSRFYCFFHVCKTHTQKPIHSYTHVQIHPSTHPPTHTWSYCPITKQHLAIPKYVAIIPGILPTILSNTCRPFFAGISTSLSILRPPHAALCCIYSQERQGGQYKHLC